MRSTFVISLAALSLGSRLVSATCEVYGIDFVNGGSYFQNVQSTGPFTAVQEFSGCSNDTANNILVDPNGDQSQCSDTPLTPDYTPETVTCSDWPKDKLYSGDWSLIIISNNGNADPIAYQRDFSLSVGTPSTATFTPTVTQTDVETSVSSIYNVTTSTMITTLVAPTTTKYAFINFPNPTLTSKPMSVQVVTEDLFTLTHTRYVPHVTMSAVQATPTCNSPKPNWIADPFAKIEVTIIKSISKAINSAKFRRAALDKDGVKKQFVAERSARLAEANKLAKRAPDASVSTVTATTSLITSTETQYSTVTSTFPTTSVVTSTSTPATVTITKALINLAKLQTEVANPFHVTITDWAVATQVETKTVPWTVTLTSTTTPADVAAACTKTGGSLGRF